MDKLISIIIPSFNRGSIIEQTLESVLTQTYGNWECLIIDDGSTDDTKEKVDKYVKKDKRFRFYNRPENRKKGANACRNFGFEKSIGDYIQWFDSDDVMHPEKLELKAEMLFENKVDFVVCTCVEFEEHINNTSKVWDNIYNETPLISVITGKLFFQTNAPLFKREFIEATSLFNETLQRKQEWEYYSRLLMVSTNYLPIDKVLYYFRKHKSSIDGENSKLTLYSRVIANRLVFKALMGHSSILKKYPELREHFLNKFIHNIKLSLRHKQPRSFHNAILGIMSTINKKLLLKGFFVILKKPIIIYNLFSIKNIR
jgi:glycosyltransferase involved in cell wall biosynthesis